jgi:oxygen-independent coproporphyrinogen-3 oxidase
VSGIYVHIPFCRRRCGYCDFFSSTETGLLDGAVEAVREELRRERGWLGGETVRTLYFGGGTPSLCSPRQLQGVVKTVREVFGCEPEEVTAEANPDDLTPEYLDALALTDIDRLSIGVQSFADRDLRLMGRRHTAQAARKAVREARKRFDNVTIDLIFGVPGMTLAQWRANLAAALELGVQHISAYHLTFEEGTPFARNLTPVDEGASEEQFLLLHEILTGAGYEHYEVSNFALPGRRARHNAAYWQGEPYLGVGPGAHSYNGRARRNFRGSIADYIAGMGEYNIETLTAADRRNELIMTRLRTAEGLPDDALAPAEAAPLIARGLLVHTAGRYRIPPEKFLLSDAVIAELFIC